MEISNNEFEYTGKGCVVPKDVTSVQFHPSVVEVEDGAFWGCGNLREVVLHDGLKKIGRGAFHTCSSLSSINLPSTFTEIGRFIGANLSSSYFALLLLCQ